jgi:hypothetical protein
VVPALTNALVGHAAALPVHASATSQSPATPRHGVLAPRKASLGQVVVEPVQLSATSQSPAVGRQVVDDGRKRATHVALTPTLPVQLSCASQSPFGGPPQAVPTGCAASAPQVAELPLHVSATSQSPTEGRHDVPEPRKLSFGQVVVEPVQLSATSQSPPDARHTVDGGRNLGMQVALAPTVPEQVSWASQSPFGGPPQEVPTGWAASAPQVAELPLHASATSQSPAEGRQVVPALTRTSFGQVVVEPVQLSATSQSPPDARHTVDDARNFGVQVALAPTVPVQVSWASQSPFGGPPQDVPTGWAASAPHVAELPLHASAASQSPTEARHVVPALTRTSDGHAAALPVHASETSQSPAEARHWVPA